MHIKRMQPYGHICYLNDPKWDTEFFSQLSDDFLNQAVSNETGESQTKDFKRKFTELISPDKVPLCEDVMSDQAVRALTA